MLYKEEEEESFYFIIFIVLCLITSQSLHTPFNNNIQLFIKSNRGREGEKYYEFLNNILSISYSNIAANYYALLVLIIIIRLKRNNTNRIIDKAN